MTVIANDLAGRRLSTREMQVLQMYAEGCTKVAIAARLYVQRSTVNTINQYLFAKLGARTAAQAVSSGYRLGYLAVEPRLAEDLAVIRAARELGCRLAVVPEQAEARRWAGEREDGT